MKLQVRINTPWSFTGWGEWCALSRGYLLHRGPGGGTGWAYFDPDGKRITDRDEIDRLNAIGLPPAYSDAWFCADPERPSPGDRDRCPRAQAISLSPRFHRQARGLEIRRPEGIRQGPAQAPAPGRAGPQAPQDGAATPCSPRSSACSTPSFIRVGNEQYARDNKSFGATTLRSRHLRRKGQKMLMRFTGKHGIVHELTLTDSHLKRVVGRCQELPGQMLFQYVNGDGEPKPITSSDVNDYIKETTGGDFTAKHFRTWGASVIAMEQLLKKAENARITRQDDDRAGRRGARQYRGDEPQGLCPPAADRRGQGRCPRSARRAWSGRARASGCRRPRSR